MSNTKAICRLESSDQARLCEAIANIELMICNVLAGCINLAIRRAAHTADLLGV